MNLLLPIETVSIMNTPFAHATCNYRVLKCLYHFYVYFCFRFLLLVIKEFFVVSGHSTRSRKQDRYTHWFATVQSLWTGSYFLLWKSWNWKWQSYVQLLCSFELLMTAWAKRGWRMTFKWSRCKVFIVAKHLNISICCFAKHRIGKLLRAREGDLVEFSHTN